MVCILGDFWRVEVVEPILPEALDIATGGLLDEPATGVLLHKLCHIVHPTTEGHPQWAAVSAISCCDLFRAERPLSFRFGNAVPSRQRQAATGREGSGDSSETMRPHIARGGAQILCARCCSCWERLEAVSRNENGITSTIQHYHCTAPYIPKFLRTRRTGGPRAWEGLEPT